MVMHSNTVHWHKQLRTKLGPGYVLDTLTFHVDVIHVQGIYIIYSKELLPVQPISVNLYVEPGAGQHVEPGAGQQA